MVKNMWFAILSLSMVLGFGVYAQPKTVGTLQRTITSVVKADMAACVKISAYDTVTKQVSTIRFSGVVVSADGYILTAAHATEPDQIYRITFPDGKQSLAKALGRITRGEQWPTTDCAMIRITEKGIYPFVKMGYTEELKDGQACVGISYPGTFERNLPNIRLGRLTNVHFSAGNLESTCKMEPGDSGGPLFNTKGELIGIHSWIKANEEQNFEVPIGLFREYWEMLKIPKTYNMDSGGFKSKYTLVVDFVMEPVPTDTIPPIQRLVKIPKKLAKSVVEVNSIINGKPVSILGTIVTYQSATKNITCIVSKSAMVGEQINVKVNDKVITGNVLERDKANDLVLLSVNAKLPTGIQIVDHGAKQTITDENIGKLLISALPENKTNIGIVSTAETELEMKYSIGYFGANADFIGNMITITDIQPGSPSASVLKMYDQVVAINNVPVSQPYQYGAEFNKYYQGDSISIDVIRNGIKTHLKVRLGIYLPNKHTADEYTGGRSIRCDGFKKVFAQDAAILAEDCGGPVFNIDREFCGINIARHSRTSTVVMPAEVIWSVLAQIFAKT